MAGQLHIRLTAYFRWADMLPERADLQSACSGDQLWGKPRPDLWVGKNAVAVDGIFYEK
jgi:hypothetical protein